MKKIYTGNQLVRAIIGASWLLILLLCTASAVNAQCVSLTTLGSASTQNFNTLSNTAGSTTNNLTITGWFMTESGGSALNNGQYGVDNGNSTAGDTYSYGTTGNTDRALGGLQSGTLNPTIGVCFTNNTGATITSLDINYFGEQWRLGTAGRTDQMNFEYSLNAMNLGSGTWTGVAALNFVTPNTVTVGLKDGNNAANRTNLISSITSLSIANGATFWIRWNDFNASGSDDGLAVDDFSLTPNTSIVDLTIIKSDGGVSVLPGGTVAYTLNYTNVGNQGATGVVITETVPANTTFNAGASSPGWVCAPNNNAGSTCTLAVGSVAQGGNGSRTFVVTVVNPVAAGVTQISNTASINDNGGNGSDPTPNHSYKQIVSIKAFDTRMSKAFSFACLLFAFPINCFICVFLFLFVADCAYFSEIFSKKISPYEFQKYTLDLQTSPKWNV